MKLIVKSKPLSNIEIISICKQYGLGLTECCMKNELHSLKVNGHYIINLENSNQNGTHWTCLISEKDSCFYFDSFGCIPPQEIQNLLQKYYKRIYFNNKIIQNLQSVLCGYFCLALLIFLKKNQKVMKKTLLQKCQQFTEIFKSDTKLNDKVLSDYILNNTD